MTEFTHPFQRAAVDVSLKQKKKKKKWSVQLCLQAGVSDVDI